MASKETEVVFTSTCDKDYDRHQYKLVLKNGKAIILEDYESARNLWYQYSSQMDHIEVLDK